MFPEGGKIQNPSPWKPQQCQGVRVQLYPSMGLGSFPEYPTLPILIMHLLLIRVLESLAVPTVPATGGQGSKKGHPPPSTSIPKAGWKAVHAGAVGSQRKHLAIHQLHPASRWTDTLVWIKELSWCSPRLGSAKSMCAPHAWLSHVQTEHTVSFGSV